MNRWNIDYFLDFFGAKQEWVDGELHGGDGSHCALGHMGFNEEENANSSYRAKRLAEMIAHHLETHYNVEFGEGERLPDHIIPTVNDSSNAWFRQDGSKLSCHHFGKTPKERMMTILNEIKQECNKRKSTERRETAK